MKTRVFILGMTGLVLAVAAAPMKRVSARISVKGDLEKKRDSSKNEGTNKSTKTKSEIQHYELQVTVANTGKEEGTFDLEWYFVKRPLDAKGKKGDPEVCEKGTKTLTIGGMKRVVHPVKSAALTSSESKTNNNGNNNNNRNNNNSSTTKSITGAVYGGYVVLLRVDGKVIAKYSPDRKYLKDEWVRKLEAYKPVARNSGARRKRS